MTTSNAGVVLITGASSGIGEALAREYARRGWKTVLLARRVERIAALAQALGGDGHSLAVACDVTHDGDCEAAVARALEVFGGVDVVIANAGFGVDGSFDQLTLDDVRRQFETNVYGVLRTAKAALPALTRAKGTFVAIGSVAGFVPAPGSMAYNMSKACIASFCDTLRTEWGPKGVSVTHVAPGFVESDIRRTDRTGVFKETRKESVPGWLIMPAKTAARQIMDAVERREDEVILTRVGKFGVGMARHAPAVTRAIFGFVAPRVGSRKAKDG
jgi:NADP-dependent 3-hydroxy acid dehydrogenase YdfG